MPANGYTADKDTSLMRVSVIMPCHNAGRWIEKALESIAAQTRPAHEIIVIDDDSTDDSVDRIQASGVKVTLLHSQHHNAAAARNDGIEVATGDWIAFLDADDYWYPRHLESAAATLDGSNDVGFMSMFDRCYQDGTIVHRQNTWPILEPTCGLTHDRFVDCWIASLRFYMITLLARRDRVNEVGRFDVTQPSRHDVELWLRVIHGHTWAFNPVATGCARHDTPGSISRARWTSSAFYMLKAVSKNLPAYRDTRLIDIVRYTGRQAVSVALQSGTKDELHRARALAWPYLNPTTKFLLTVGGCCRPAYRFIHGAVQKIKQRHKKD